jgi:hypothetical protein
VTKQAVLAGQLVATLIILSWVPTNIAKTAFLLSVWFITFTTLTRQEIVLFVNACLLFSVMDTAALRQGIFAFDNPDLFGLPYYEFFMWGFYLLHTLRMLDGPPPRTPGKSALLLAVVFAACFSTISDQYILLATTSVILVVAFFIHHERLDFAYFAYMVFLGAIFEFTGVQTGLWHYPGYHPGGVPFWFVTLWGGVGLFLRRLVLPMLSPSNRPEIRY